MDVTGLLALGEAQGFERAPLARLLTYAFDGMSEGLSERMKREREK